MIDLAQWGHDTERTGPVEVEGKGDFPPRDAVFNTAPTFDVHYQYADGVTMNVSAGQGDLDPGIRLRGDRRLGSASRQTAGERPLARPSRAARCSTSGSTRTKVKLYRPSEIVGRSDGGKGGEHRNFLDCVKSRKPCYAPAETGHRTITIAHIGNIAMLLGRKLRWNPEAERFVDDAEADAMLTRKQREPWTIANIDSWIKKNA